jgi:hypothetical protein
MCGICHKMASQLGCRLLGVDFADHYVRYGSQPAPTVCDPTPQTPIPACAAASLAIGTRNGEQLT